MDDKQERELYLSIGRLEANQESVCDRVDNLVKLLTPRIEKWDKTSVITDDNKDTLEKRSPIWDTAAVRASVMNKIALGVAISVLAGGVGFLFFK